MADAVADAVPPLGGETATAAALDAMFTLSSAYLVFFMHCGFAMLSVGSVRARFSKHICILILLDACASAIGFYLFGYALAYGDAGSPNSFIGGRTYFAMSDLPAAGPAFAPQYYQWLFQWSFAATACTIVSGAIAERTRFEAYFAYSFFMAAWVYPVVVHSIWSPAGWANMGRSTGPLLAGTGAIDFAGSGAVHMVGGLAAAAGALIVGPRIGRFLPDGTVVNMPGHNSSLFILGVMILWFGWYGFNPGSQQAIVGASHFAAVSNAAVTTTLAPAAAGLSALLIGALESKVKTGKAMYGVENMGNGALSGLAAITASCNVVYPWAAIAIGTVAGALYTVASKLSIRMRLDDPLDAVAVHAYNGMWGVIAAGLFSSKKLVEQSYGTGTPDAPILRRDGAFLGGGGGQLAAQLAYLCWVAAWVIGNMAPFWFILKKLGFLRVPSDEEIVGLDHSYHGGSAYPGGPEELEDPSTKAGGGGGGKELAGIKAELAALKAAVAKVSTA